MRKAYIAMISLIHGIKTIRLKLKKVGKTTRPFKLTHSIIEYYNYESKQIL